jgi:hypothetical protein
MHDRYSPAMNFLGFSHHFQVSISSGNIEIPFLVRILPVGKIWRNIFSPAGIKKVFLKLAIA